MPQKKIPVFYHKMSPPKLTVWGGNPQFLDITGRRLRHRGFLSSAIKGHAPRLSRLWGSARALKGGKSAVLDDVADLPNGEGVLCDAVMPRVITSPKPDLTQIPGSDHQNRWSSNGSMLVRGIGFDPYPHHIIWILKKKRSFLELFT